MKNLKISAITSKINSLTETFRISLIVMVAFLFILDLVLVASIIWQATLKTPPTLIQQVKSANLPTLEIVQPGQGATISNEFPVVLSYSDNSAGFSKILVLVDGILEKEIEGNGASLIKFTLDSTKFPAGPQKLTFKVTNTDQTTQTLQLSLNLVKKS